MIILELIDGCLWAVSVTVMADPQAGVPPYPINNYYEPKIYTALMDYRANIFELGTHSEDFAFYI